MKRIKLFLSWIYVLNFPLGSDAKITKWQYYYKYRVGIKSAWDISRKIIEINKNKQR